MLNFPDSPTPGTEFLASPKANFIFTATPDRWRRKVYVPPPLALIAVSPGHGPINTTQPADVLGTGFTTATKVAFGAAGIIPATFVSSTLLRITVPSSAATGPQNVYVSNDPAGLDWVGPVEYLYEAIPLVLTSLNPDASIQGTISGGGPNVVLTGSGFNSNCWVWWNGFMNQTTYQSPTQLTALAVENRTVGTFPVYVKDNQTQAVSNTVDFFVTSNQPPKLTSVSPNTTQQGSTIATLTVTGQNFVNGKRIVLDGVPVATTYVNASTLTTTNVLAKISYPKIKVQVEECPGELSVNCTALPGSTPIGEVIPEVWPHSHQTAPYYGRNFLVYSGGYSDADEVWIRDAYLEPPNWILHESWPEDGLLMFQASYLGGPVQKIFADVMLKKGGVQSGNTARLIIGGT